MGLTATLFVVWCASAFASLCLYHSTSLCHFLPLSVSLPLSTPTCLSLWRAIAGSTGDASVTVRVKTARFGIVYFGAAPSKAKSYYKLSIGVPLSSIHTTLTRCIAGSGCEVVADAVTPTASYK